MADPNDHKSVVMVALLASKMLLQYDIPGLIELAERAITVGPFLDPTLWREKHKALEEDLSILRAALPLWHFAKKLRDEAGEKVA